jgi:hypothetical protein
VKLYDLLVGTNGTPADNSMEWTIQRTTAGSTQTYTGIVSSRTNALDPADASMAAMAYVNSSAETGTLAFTAGTNPLYVGVNQRASYRWVAAPGGELERPCCPVEKCDGLHGHIDRNDLDSRAVKMSPQDLADSGFVMLAVALARLEPDRAEQFLRLVEGGALRRCAAKGDPLPDAVLPRPMGNGTLLH